MKKNILNIFLVIVCLGFYACDDFLDETPKGKVIPKTVNDMQMMLDSYFGAGSNEIAHGVSVPILLADNIKIPEEVYSNLNVSLQNALEWKEYVYAFDENDKDWNSQYKIIYTCNWVIENIDEAELDGLKETDRETLKATAYVHRSYAFFLLVNLYAKQYDEQTAATDLGVPMPLVSDINKRFPRATVKVVYDQITKDVTDYVEKLPEIAKYNFRPSQAAAYGILAKIYFQQENYAKAIENAEKALEIKNDLFDFNTIDAGGDVDGWFEEFEVLRNKEVIYSKAIFNDTQQNIIPENLVNLFDKDNDMRFKLFATDTEPFSPVKTDYWRIGDLYWKSGGINVGSLYTMLAECKVRENDLEGAREALNILRNKRFKTDTPEITENNAAELLTFALDERRRETMFKGTRLFDLKRLHNDPRFQKPVIHEVNDQTLTLEPGSNRLIMPIPSNVIAKNPLIKQNPR